MRTKKFTLLIIFFISSNIFSQQISDGYAPIISDFTVPINSGVYNAMNPIGLIPDTSFPGGWQHLIVVRHPNPNNNHQLQIASAMTTNDRLFFRKIAGGLGPNNPVWFELATRGTNMFIGDQTISGNLGIGTMNPTNRLDVNGTIHSKEVKVDMNGWSDFVFKKEYDLPTLEEVEKHIKEKGHLEDIPSEEEVLKDGINLGEMNTKLLQKIEELTLYVIEQNKKLEKQTNEMEIIKKENQNFKLVFERLTKIEEKLK